MKMDDNRLRELQAENLSKATAATVGIVPTPGQEDVPDTLNLIALADEYFANFCASEKPDAPIKCPCCGFGLGVLLGTFVWGIAHGEGTCSSCGYPCRAHHPIYEQGNDEPVMTLQNMVLPYHPSVLEPCEAV